MRIVDTHCHLIERGRLSYPWLAAVPGLDRDAALADYLPQARAAGITDIVFMEADVAEPQIEAEAEWAASLPELAGVVAACRPERAEFARQAERLAASGRVKGLRRVLHTADGWLAGVPGFTQNLRLLPRLGLSFELCVRADQIGAAVALVDACPDVAFVLDHCGNPPIGGELGRWRADVAALAERAGVVCKLSGLVNHAGPGWKDAALLPVIGWVVERFGPARLVWGSDWPVCTLAGSLGEWVAGSRRLLAGLLGEAEVADVLGHNARRIYRLEG